MALPATRMAFIATIAPDQASGEARDAYRHMREVAGAGQVARVVQLFSPRPASMRRMIRSWELAMWMGGEPRVPREFLAATVSRLNDCHYWIDAHEAFLQAAGGDASRVGAVVDGRVAGTPLETALVALARKSCEAPVRLEPSDLGPLRRLVGDGALEYVLVLSLFHFVNRMADLLAVDPEVPGLPWLRRVEPIRRGVVRVMSLLLGRMDLASRVYTCSFEDALGMLPAAVDRAALGSLRACPQVVEAIALALDERDLRSGLDRATLARVHATVETALPASAADVEGFHARPSDPILAFAFVGTRYAQRTTQAMIDALRAAGLGDLELLDLAIAVADANQWARMHRLLGLPREIFALSEA